MIARVLVVGPDSLISFEDGYDAIIHLGWAHRDSASAYQIPWYQAAPLVADWLPFIVIVAVLFAASIARWHTVEEVWHNGPGGPNR